jgi:hypothetical protein
MPVNKPFDKLRANGVEAPLLHRQRDVCHALAANKGQATGRRFPPRANAHEASVFKDAPEPLFYQRRCICRPPFCPRMPTRRDTD